MSPSNIMKTGYLYLIDGKVVVNSEKKPERSWMDEDTRIFITWDEYQHKVLKDWQANGIVVENTTKNIPGPKPLKGYPVISTFNNRLTFYIGDFPTKGVMFLSGQKCEHSQGKITKLLN